MEHLAGVVVLQNRVTVVGGDGQIAAADVGVDTEDHAVNEASLALYVEDGAGLHLDEDEPDQLAVHRKVVPDNHLGAQVGASGLDRLVHRGDVRERRGRALQRRSLLLTYWDCPVAIGGPGLAGKAKLRLVGVGNEPPIHQADRRSLALLSRGGPAGDSESPADDVDCLVHFNWDLGFTCLAVPDAAKETGPTAEEL